MQELQTACRGTASTAAAVDQLQQEVQDLAQSQQQLRAHTDACHSSASSSSRQLQEVAQHLQQLDERVAGQTSDLTGLAEAVLGCLGAARQHAAAAAAAATPPPSSYLSNLLGPAVPPPPPVAPAASKQQWGAWVSEAGYCLNSTVRVGPTASQVLLLAWQRVLLAAVLRMPVYLTHCHCCVAAGRAADAGGWACGEAAAAAACGRVQRERCTCPPGLSCQVRVRHASVPAQARVRQGLTVNLAHIAVQQAELHAQEHTQYLLALCLGRAAGSILMHRFVTRLRRSF